MATPDHGLPFPQDEFTVRGKPLPPMPTGWRNLTKAIVRQARKTPEKIFAHDHFDGSSITFKELVQRSAAASLSIKRDIGKRKNIGILLPPGIPGAIANLAVAMSGNRIVDLNLLSAKIANGCIADGKIPHVITARAALKKLKIEKLDAEFYFIEDIAKKVTAHDKLVAFNVSTLMPLTGMSEWFAGAGRHPQGTAAIMYTSGSTGTPKGAQLTNHNILSNIWQIKHHLDLHDDDVLLGVLPFFHSFGFTVTLFAAMALGLTVAFNPSPRDGREVGEVMEKYGVTIVLSTPTIMRMWMERITAEQMKRVRILMLGSEPLTADLVRDVQAKYGITARSGYGCTELSPCVSGEVPGKIIIEDGREVEGTYLGSIGFPFPGTEVAIVDEETGELLKPGQKTADGKKFRQEFIFVRGPQVMKGYNGRQEETDAVLKNGWYFTGDIGRVDDECRMFITGRASRRIKIGAEMVPLVYIEEAIRAVTGITELEMITDGVPDKKGERLIVLYTNLGKNADGSERTGSDVVALLGKTDLPSLWTPKPNSFFRIKAMPINPTGKTDLKEVKRLALELSGATS